MTKPVLAADLTEAAGLRDYPLARRSMLMTGMDNHVVGLGNMVELLSDNQRGKPGYEGKLTKEQIDGLVKYVRSLKK